MLIKIPYNKRELKADGTVKEESGEISAFLDMSVLAEEKWEKHFPENAKRETVFGYIERVTQADKANSAASVVTNLKALYCFLDSDNLSDFKSFARLFDLSDRKTLERQIGVIKSAFEAVLNGSAAKSGN